MTMTFEQRGELIREIQNLLADGKIEVCDAVRRLRTEITGLNQENFAKMCDISSRTLSHIEHGEGNQTVKSLNAVFKPFGLQVGIVPINRN